MGVDFKSKVLPLAGERVKLQVRRAPPPAAGRRAAPRRAAPLPPGRPRLALSFTRLRCPRPLLAQVWDTAGQERFRTISLSFLRGAQGIALCFDITDRKTFDHVENWMKQVKTQSEDIPMVLIANKCDLAADGGAAVTHDEAEAAAKSFGMTVFFTSAKTGDNVEAAFTHLGKIAAEKALAAKANKPPPVGVVNLKDAAPNAAAAGCAC